MTLQEYITGLTTFLELHPEYEDLTVYTACDDEGNNYSKVYYDPSVFFMNEEGDFLTEDDVSMHDWDLSVTPVVVVN